MKTGVLNELLNISCKMSLPLKEVGDLIKYEPVSLPWQMVRNMPFELTLKLEKECFVDRVQVNIGNSTKLTSVTLCDDKNTLFTHSAETGKTITNRCIILKAGSLTDTLTISFTSDFSDVEILGVKLYGAIPDEKDIFPTPDSITFGEKTVCSCVFDSYSGDSKEGCEAGAVLAEKYAEITGVKMTELVNSKVKFVTDNDIKKEGFRLDISENGAVIAASDKRGFVMGVETFIKLCDKDKVHTAKIEDAPAYPFRGVHLFLPSERQMGFAKRLIKYMISPMGYNNVIIEVAGGMRFDTHPEINEAFIHANKMHAEGKWPEFPHAGIAEGGCTSKEAVADFVDYIRSFGIDVIPEVQSLGHVQFMTLAHPEIAEIDANAVDINADTVTADARPKTFYKHCYCPSNPKSYEILFDLIDEIVEVFKPREYVHMGHDEVYELGVCPVCKNKDGAQLYYDDIMKIRAHLASKGLKMMIWSDMIQPVSHYTSRPAIDMLPKDILMLDFIWYFHFDKDIEDNLLEKGYTVAIGNLYSSHYPRFETRIRKDGMIGGQISAWVTTCESSLQREGKLYDFLMTGQMLWSDSYRKIYTLCYDKMIKAMMPKMRENLKGIKYPSLNDGAVFETIARSDVDFPPKTSVNQKVDITVDGEYKSLIFSHTELKKLIRLPWFDYDVTGKYILTYSDGTMEEIDITNNGIIGHWNRRQNEAVTHPMYRHTGYTSTYYTDSDEFKTSDGENICIYKYEHILPEGKKLTNVKLEQSEKFDTDIFLVKLEGVK